MTLREDVSGSTRRRILSLAALAGGALVASRVIHGRPARPAPTLDLSEALAPEQFGAKGDGAHDDTDAFLALSAKLAANNGGVVTLRPGATYIVGRQSRGSTNYLDGHPILFAENVPRFEVWMNNAVLKFKDGMLFGSFDPLTGRPKATTAPHLDFGDRADIGYAISARNVGYFAVRDGHIDGNSQNAIIGGEWGDTGRQCVHYGVSAFSCDHVELDRLFISNSCLDGISYAFDGLTGQDKPRPFSARHLRIENVGRNCVSLVGTNQAVFEDCELRSAGDAPNLQMGSLRSAPASCFDLEAEGAECRNVSIRTSRLISGRGTAAAFIADSGDTSGILIEDTELVGVVWTSKPRTIFRRCDIAGIVGRLYGGDPDPDKNSRIVDTRVTDIAPATVSSPPAYLYAIDLEAAGPGVHIAGSTITVRNRRLNLRGGSIRDTRIRFLVGTTHIRNRDFAILADGASLHRVLIIDAIPPGVRPADAFFVTAPVPGSQAAIQSDTRKLMWNSWSPAANGFVGNLPR